MRLYKTDGGLFGIDGGLRRKFVDMKDFHSWGLNTDDIEVVSEAELRAFPRGGAVPYCWTLNDWLVTPTPDNKRKMREISACQIKGSGVEFGAGSRPFQFL